MENQPQPAEESDTEQIVTAGVMRTILRLSQADPQRFDALLNHTWTSLSSEQQHAITAPFRLLFESHFDPMAFQMHVKASVLDHFIRNEQQALMEWFGEVAALPVVAAKSDQQAP